MLIESRGVFSRNAFRMPMQAGELVFMKQVGELGVYLLSEGSAADQSGPNSVRVTLNAKEWGAITFYPRVLAEDALLEIGEMIARSFVNAFALKADSIGFNGDRTKPYFGIEGIIPKLSASTASSRAAG